MRLPVDLRREMRAALRAEPHQTFLRDAVWARAAIVAAAKARTCQRATTKAAMTEFRRAVDALLVEMQDILLDQLGKRAGR